MIELSKDQIELAVKAAWEAFRGDGKKFSEAAFKDEWRNAITAAAPFLQCPIALPTEEEYKEALEDCYVVDNCSLRNAIAQFVARRNAALSPPVDPRREKVRDALVRHAVSVPTLTVSTQDQFDIITDAIFEALSWEGEK